MFNPMPVESDTKTAEQLSAELTEWVCDFVMRKQRLMKAAKHLRCPNCKAEQIQLVHTYKFATWQCRECSHFWTQEPLVLLSIT